MQMEWKANGEAMEAGRETAGDTEGPSSGKNKEHSTEAKGQPTRWNPRGAQREPKEQHEWNAKGNKKHPMAKAWAPDVESKGTVNPKGMHGIPTKPRVQNQVGNPMETKGHPRDQQKQAKKRTHI